MIRPKKYNFGTEIFLFFEELWETQKRYDIVTRIVRTIE